MVDINMWSQLGSYMVDIIQSKNRQEERIGDESERVNEIIGSHTLLSRKSAVIVVTTWRKIQSVCPYRTLGTFIVHDLKFKSLYMKRNQIFDIVQATCLVFIEC